MDAARFLLLQEIVRQCRFAMKAKADMDKADLSLQEIMQRNSGNFQTGDITIHIFDEIENMKLQRNYSQQAFLVASGIVSRCLGWHGDVRDKPAREALRKDLGIDEATCPLKHRWVRDAFEHIDERIESYASGNTFVVDSNVNYRGVQWISPDVTPLRHTDVSAQEVSAQNQSGGKISMDYGAVYAEVSRIAPLAETALDEMGSQGDEDFEQFMKSGDFEPPPPSTPETIE